jgi:ribosome-associated translation inhibitor RaiA
MYSFCVKQHNSSSRKITSLEYIDSTIEESFSTNVKKEKSLHAAEAYFPVMKKLIHHDDDHGDIDSDIDSDSDTPFFDMFNQFK